MPKTWLVTGCSSGLGRAIAEEVLAAGDSVITTARRREEVEHFASEYPLRALPLALDVTDQQSVDRAVASAMDWRGAIDVLVNNAGYGLYGAVEETSEQEIRALFETNVLGVGRMLCAVLPRMRKVKSGTIVNVGSVAGLVGGAGNGYYSASKFALEALSEALRDELSPLGIRVLLIEPAGIRTDFHGRSYRRAARRIPDYEATAGQRITATLGLDGRQSGDPHRIARTLRDLVESADPPFRLLMGATCVERVRSKLLSMLERIDGWKKVSLSTDFDPR